MNHYATLNQKLQQMFQINRPDLDFGVYRILNARRDEISDYLNNRLKAKVEQYLAETKQDVSGSQKQTLIARIKDEFGKRAFDDNGILVDTDALASQDGQAYQQLLAQADSSFDEGQVYSHLATFFSRYYDEGDFISQRRYKGDTYAIPYAGEEVMLHWANKDQYYTKSSEMFSNYRIRFDELADLEAMDKILNFRLLSADTAKDNQKDNDKKRVFVILTEEKDVPYIADDGEEQIKKVTPVELSEDGKELTVWFEYVALDTKNSQDKINETTHDNVLQHEAMTTDWDKVLTSPAPTEKNPKRDLFTKHLTNYTTKNTADYFIHKDLGKFLNNELDFFIKNEVMHLDDVVNSDSFAHIEKQLAIVKCVRLIGQELIGFLASLEDFQKRLWLKKKFVVYSYYCVTLDRVDTDLYGEIASNDKQWEQWESLGFRDAIGQAWGKVDALSQFPYLMIDTSLFDGEFRAKLLRGFDDLDGQTDGVIIHSDNFQGLNLLQEKYREQVQCIYIDPPYNTDASSIIYKNGFKDSSWLSLIENRLEIGKKLLKLTGVMCLAIDDEEVSNLTKLCEQHFAKVLGIGVIRSNPVGRKTTGRLTPVHEYALFYGNDLTAKLNPLSKITEQNIKRYPHEDEKGRFSWLNFIRTGNNDLRTDSPTMYYPIIVGKDDSLRIPKMKYISATEGFEILEEIGIDEEILYPIKDINGRLVEKNWQRGWDRFSKELSEYRVRRVDGKISIDFKARMDEGALPRTWWDDSEYASSNYGALDMKNLFIQAEFSYPKSRYLVKDCLKTSGLTDNKSIAIDYFAGSGTTAHATIDLNREDKGNRKYILIEQGEYFNTVIKPRIQKIVFSENYKDGKPILPKDNKNISEDNPYNGISHCLKVIKLESYEDTLNNLELTRTGQQQQLFDSMNDRQKDDYLMHYMLDIESKGSLLSVKDFANPFAYQLKITTDSAGAYTRQPIDLIDTFNYLIGLNVQNIDYQIERGYVFIEGTLRTGEKTLVFWRSTDKIGYEQLETTLLDRLKVNPKDKEYQLIYLNGDHNIPSPFITTEEGDKKLKIRSIEQTFFEKMFDE